MLFVSETISGRMKSSHDSVIPAEAGIQAFNGYRAPAFE
jgi:hypothetical protein